MRAHEVQQCRAALGMSQNALGRFLELEAIDPTRTVRNWESGKVKIPGPVAVAIRLEMKRRRVKC